MNSNTMEVTQNICCLKGEGAVCHTRVTRSFKKFCSGCKNLDNQGDIKLEDFKGVFPTIKANPTSSTRIVPREFSISQSSVVCQLDNLGGKKAARVAKLTLKLQKYCKTPDSSLYLTKMLKNQTQFTLWKNYIRQSKTPYE